MSFVKGLYDANAKSESHGAVSNREEGLSNEIRLAKQFIDKNFHCHLTLDVVAKQVYISPAYLCTTFKREMHISFVEYLTVVRMENAKHMLKMTKYTTWQIAERVGYRDTAYFRKLFFAYCGTLPSTYRESVS